MLKRIVVLVSGGGSNLQALIDAQHSGVLKSGGIVRVISSKPDAFALTRAARAGIETQVLCPGDYETRAAFDTALLAALADARADLVVLAGFLYVLGPQVVKAYPRRIINVHPSLIPSFCGDGFYGLRVHRAALDYGVKVTGAGNTAKARNGAGRMGAAATGGRAGLPGRGGGAIKWSF